MVRVEDEHPQEPGRAHSNTGGLTDGRLAGIDTPAIVFSGPGGALETFPFHSPDDVRRLHDALPRSQLVISSEYLGDQWEHVLEQLEREDSSFDPLVAALAERISKFVRDVEQLP